MSDGDPTLAERPRLSVFLSYASEDREAVRAIRDALEALGLEAWYDESELDGGDAWDQKIRRQIRECDLFMPVVSARTEARREGYFRREWRLAVERTQDMADDHIFLLPIVIDDTDEAAARVPERFLSVQWTRLPGGKPTPAFEALCRRLSSGDAQALQAPKPSLARAVRRRGERAPRPPIPEFPKYDAQPKAGYAGAIALWSVRCVWALFLHLPKFVRVIVYVWLIAVVFQKGCAMLPGNDSAEGISPAQAKKIREISEKYSSSRGPGAPNVAELASQIAKNFPVEGNEAQAAHNVLLAVPFSAPANDAAAKSLADSVFAQVYGRVAISHRGKVSLPEGALPAADLAAAIERGRAQHAKYILYGAIETPPGVATLNVKYVTVADGSLVWSASYPVPGADPARIAAEIEAKVPSLDDDE
jgi:hypothetical protein